MPSPVQDPPAPAALAARVRRTDKTNTLIAATSTVYACVELGVPAALEDEPVELDALALRLGVVADPLSRLLRFAASLDVVRRRPDGRYEPGPLMPFVPDAVPPRHGYDARDAVLMAWASLADAVRTGTPAFDLAHGSPIFDYMRNDARMRAAFQASMVERAGARDRAVSEVWPFPDAGTVVDLGGGTGTLVGAVLADRPSLRGVLFDLPEVLEEEYDEDRFQPHVRSRIATVAGSLFDGPVPRGDVYLLSSVIHDWDDERALEILRTCRSTMAPDAPLLLVEMLMPLPQDPFAGNLLDLSMLVLTGGRERTEAEYEALLDAAGLTLVATRTARSWWSVIEAHANTAAVLR